MYVSLTSWLYETGAATAIEYVLIMSAVALGIAAVVFFLGDAVLALFQSFIDVLS